VSLVIRSILEFLPVVASRVLETFGFEGESQLISSLLNNAVFRAFRSEVLRFC
jgi:hypothetical protein